MRYVPATVASDALTLLAEGYSVLATKDDDYCLQEIAMQMLQNIGSLTDEFSQECFTDDEIELITQATVMCLDTFMTSAEQGDF